jgi:hypothetical protein
MNTVTPAQPQLPLEFRTPPVAEGTALFTTNVRVKGNTSDDKYDVLNYHANTRGEDGAVFVAGTVQEAFARARASTNPYKPEFDRTYSGDAAAVVQAKDGFWILPTYIRNEWSDITNEDYAESSPDFAPNFARADNIHESRSWTALQPDVVGIALWGKVLDMTKAKSYTFDRTSTPPVC